MVAISSLLLYSCSFLGSACTFFCPHFARWCVRKSVWHWHLVLSELTFCVILVCLLSCHLLTYAYSGCLATNTPERLQSPKACLWFIAIPCLLVTIESFVWCFVEGLTTFRNIVYCLQLPITCFTFRRGCSTGYVAGITSSHLFRAVIHIYIGCGVVCHFCVIICSVFLVYTSELLNTLHQDHKLLPHSMLRCSPSLAACRVGHLDRLPHHLCSLPPHISRFIFSCEQPQLCIVDILM